jgi:gliding motility-associated-like protein
VHNGPGESILGHTDALHSFFYYRVSIKVSNAEAYINASEGLQVEFYSTNAYPPAPQIDYLHYGLMTDTLWQELVDTFYNTTAAYDRIMIGNFHNYVQQLIYGSSYYFIDEVEVLPIGPFFVYPTQTNVSCHGGTDGALSLDVQGGKPPVTYSWWPGGQTTSAISGLSAGMYVCTILDSTAFPVHDTFYITEPTVLSVSISHTNTCDHGNNGTATATASGGTPPYTYQWTPSGGNSPDVTGMAPGTYTCTVTDSNNCVATATVVILDPPTLTATSVQTDVSCNGGSDGAATVTASGGTPGYHYSWAPVAGNTTTLTGLSAGSYTCTITDDNTCTHDIVVNINEPVAPETNPTQSNVPCYGEAGGIASVNVTGGTAPYTYIWSPTGGAAATASGLVAGNYTCTITDANGCAFSQDFVIDQAPEISLTMHPASISCYGMHDGAMSVSVSGGAPGYSYSWSPVAGSDSVINGLDAGSYTCTVTDANGCVVSATAVVVEPDPLSVSDKASVVCYGRNDGKAQVVVSGGTVPYSYFWSPAGGNGPIAYSLAPGTYSCLITDAHGCIIDDTVTLYEDDPIRAGFIFETSPLTANEPIKFHNSSSPNVISYEWDFGDNTYSSDEDPSKLYNDSGRYTVCLVVNDNNSCADTSCQDVTSYLTKVAGVPSAFSPNGDGSNDVLYVRGYRIAAMDLRIYDRWGDMIFESTSQSKGWDGTYKGQLQAPQVFAYTLSVTFSDGSSMKKTGSITLLW